MMKRLLPSLVVLWLCIVPIAGGSINAEPVLLHVYLFDRCGGCGSDNPGCGECKDVNRTHDTIKGQLGDRLYNGTIVYRILNCRYTANEIACKERGEQYGVPVELMNFRPITYIGTEDAGLYLPGDGLLPFAAEIIDRYIGGDGLTEIQADILKVYERSKGESD